MKKRFLGLCLCMVMLMSLLTGCMSEIVSVSIKEDGTGKAVISAGFTEEMLKMIAEQDGDALDEVKAEYEQFAYNGVKYWGRTEEMNFSSIEELDSIFNTDPFEPGTFSIVKNDDGGITFKLFVTKPEDGIDELQSGFDFDSDITEAEMEALLKDMALVINIYFPSKVYQIAGPTENILVKDTQIKLDLMDLNLTDKTTAYVFTTSVKDNQPVVTHLFKDVAKDKWYYDAVTTMSISGLVNGVGGGMFNPEQPMTYGQFCQVLARAKGLPTGTEHGYWAYTAIESCLSYGYIESRGEIKPSNYEVNISREAAVAGITRAKAYELYPKNDEYTYKLIPDYQSIDEKYQADIVDAYKFGITTGVDSNHTFSPKSALTRGQVCQLFYNLNWVTPDLPMVYGED